MVKATRRSSMMTGTPSQREKMTGSAKAAKAAAGLTSTMV
jgi:hypothetical protein